MPATFSSIKSEDVRLIEMNNVLKVFPYISKLTIIVNIVIVIKILTATNIFNTKNITF